MTKPASRTQYIDVDESDRPASPALAQFDDLYTREIDYVWRTLGRLGVQPRDLDDAAHEVFIVVYRRWNDFDQTRPARPWLFGIARRIAAAHRRKPQIEVGAPDVAPDDRDRFVRRDLLWRALSELPDDRLEVIVLHDLEGHTGQAIADQLGISVNTVHSRLRLAREDLIASVRKLERGR